MAVSAPVAVAIHVLLVVDGGAPDGGAPRARSLLEPIPVPSITRSDRDGGYELRPAGDGSGDLVYQASEFTARVAPDGTVAFRDRRPGSTWFPFRPPRTPYAVPTLESKVRDLLRRRTSPPPEQNDSGPPPETTTTIPDVTRYRPDPRELCQSCELDSSRIVPVQAGRGDLTDELMRMNGQDPHRFEKARFLVATRERRIRMAVKLHAENIRRAAADLPRQLSAIACDDRLSTRDRRAILAALRDEMDTSTAPGHAAAKQIDAFLVRFDALDRAQLCTPHR